MSPPAIPERTIATATGPRRGNSRTPPPHLTFPTPHPPQPLHPSHPPSPPRGQHLARPTIRRKLSARRKQFRRFPTGKFPPSGDFPWKRRAKGPLARRPAQARQTALARRAARRRRARTAVGPLEPGSHHVPVVMPACPERIPVPRVPGNSPRLNNIPDIKPIRIHAPHHNPAKGTTTPKCPADGERADAGRAPGGGWGYVGACA
jgi:hypothetical protein